MAKKQSQTSETTKPEQDTMKTIEPVKSTKKKQTEEVIYWSKNRFPMIAYNTGNFQQQLQGGILQMTQEQKWVKFDNHYYRTSDPVIIGHMDRIIEETLAKKQSLPFMRYDGRTQPDRYVTIKLGEEQFTVLESEVNEKVQEFLIKQKTDNSEIKTF